MYMTATLYIFGLLIISNVVILTALHFANKLIKKFIEKE